MAFDFGLRQIGVATGNRLLGTTSALPVLRARDGVPDWDGLGSVIAQWSPALLVVGDPLNMDGSAGELCQRARKFAQRLRGRFNLEVEMCDERLSSYEVKSQQRDLGHAGDYRRHPVDSLAAELILRTWLAEHPLPRGPQTSA